jgi:hypothetical protein
MADRWHSRREIDVVYYLVHSMGGRGSFIDAERESAQNVATAARAAGVEGIVCPADCTPLRKTCRHI